MIIIERNLRKKDSFNILQTLSSAFSRMDSFKISKLKNVSHLFGMVGLVGLFEKKKKFPVGHLHCT